jgi:tetratricopeptide (TPR) repeat protein
MENGIQEISGLNKSGDAFYTMLLAIMNESLDEDETAVSLLTKFSGSSIARPFVDELSDFITIGKMITLREYDLLETSADIMIQKYTGADTITDTLSNLYLRIDDEAYNPVFQILMDKAKAHYSFSVALESLTGFINIKAKDYGKALESFMAIKEKAEKETDNIYYHFNMASTWDNIAGCYLKLGDAEKTIECCDIAIDHEEKSDELKVGSQILYKKAEALIMKGDKEQALILANRILAESPEDEKAQELAGKSLP